MNFRKVTDAVFMRGGKNPQSDLRRVALEPQLNALINRAGSYQRRGIHVVRPAVVKSISVKSLTPRSGSKAAQALLQVCVDSTNSEVLDKAGRSVVKRTALHFFIETVNMAQFKPGQWLVVQEADKQVKTC